MREDRNDLVVGELGVIETHAQRWDVGLHVLLLSGTEHYDIETAVFQISWREAAHPELRSDSRCIEVCHVHGP